MTTAPVVLLHGLGRTGASMSSLARYLRDAGFETLIVSYPSRRDPLSSLASTVSTEIHERLPNLDRFSFVTHSMGGIVLRTMVAHGLLQVQRAVMLAPPNGGSEVVNGLRRVPFVSRIMGPAFLQLSVGTDAESSWVSGLPSPDFELGVIAGRQWTPFFSPLLPGPGDGKVTVASTRIEGMSDHQVVRTGHTWMMGDRQVQACTLAFLRNGSFGDAGQRAG
ncbi:MAG: alpha/beta fold hydrolase [Pseudomonadota bacterium]